MNFVGHHEVACRAELDAAGRLGSMLPDFATMLGVRLRPLELPIEVRAGVQLHHDTDAVFHAHDAVRAGMRSLTSAATDAGVGRGAARAIGHVGYEMILDGALRTSGVAGTLTAHIATDGRIDAALDRHPEWSTMRHHLATRTAHYDDIEWVAERLYAVLARRPRLAFPRHHLSAVASALDTVAAPVRASAPDVFAQVTAALAARATPGRTMQRKPRCAVEVSVDSG